MISKLEENLGDTDIKNFTVSPLYQIKCTSKVSVVVEDLTRIHYYSSACPIME